MNPPSTSDEARKLRQDLHAAEIALRDQRERVAEMRRALPRDTPAEDYALEIWRNGNAEASSLSELFDDPSLPLVVVHFMYGKAQEAPCPMCTLWADGYSSAVSHLRRRANFAVLVASDLEGFAAYAAERGWDELTLVSAGSSTIKTDLGLESESGAQMPGVSVFEKDDDGRLTHFYSVCAFGPDGGRMMDLLSPVWNFFDLTPEGRGEFMPRRSYVD
jgi:predicted dithiol-disulfide oxidoreductase (DUF899 family)